MMSLIKRETDHAHAKKPARIVAKMNALVDREIIAALYVASQAGVQIELIIRGICCLRPGLPGISENIRVRSIVGRFLEHSRIFYFENAGDPKVFVGSADWMPRNFFRRIEVVFPIQDPALRERVVTQILGTQLADTAKASMLGPDGNFKRSLVTKEKVRRNSQAEFMALALGDSKPRKKHRPGTRRPVQFQVVRTPIVRTEPPTAA